MKVCDECKKLLKEAYDVVVIEYAGKGRCEVCRQNRHLDEVEMKKKERKK